MLRVWTVFALCAEFVVLSLVLTGCNTAPVVARATQPALRANQFLLRSTDGYDGVFVAALSNQGFIVQPVNEGDGVATVANEDSSAEAATGDPKVATKPAAPCNSKDKDKDKDRAESKDSSKEIAKNADKNAVKDKTMKAALSSIDEGACLTHGTDNKAEHPVATQKDLLRAYRKGGFEYELQLSITHDEQSMCMLSDGHRVSVIMSVVQIDTNKTVLVLKHVGLDRDCPPWGSVWEPLAHDLRTAWYGNG
jgi:hypothetical protein